MKVFSVFHSITTNRRVAATNGPFTKLFGPTITRYKNRPDRDAAAPAWSAYLRHSPAAQNNRASASTGRPCTQNCAPRCSRCMRATRSAGERDLTTLLARSMHDLCASHAEGIPIWSICINESPCSAMCIEDTVPHIAVQAAQSIRVERTIGIQTG